MYTLKETCKIIGLTEHTIRYYTDQGLIPNSKRDKNNRRIFDDEALDWLRGTKYLRELGMSIEDIKQYHQLCLQNGDEAINERYQIILKYLQLANEELETAKKRQAFLQKQAIKEKQILEHLIPDAKNPGRKYHK